MPLDHYVTLGNSGLRVSPLCLGAMTFGEVEKGFKTPFPDRAGPFDTAEEAARAPEIIKERSRAWAEEEAREDG